jgi:large repetitive protein
MQNIFRIRYLCRMGGALSILLLSLYLTGSVSNLWAAQGDQRRPPYVPGEVLVKFKASTSPMKVQEVNIGIGASVKREFHHIGLKNLRLSGQFSVPEAVEQYRKDPSVEYAQPNYILSISSTPTDPDFNKLWGLVNTGQTGGTPGADIQMVEAWNITPGSPDVVIAVIDTGVTLDHPDLAGNLLGCWDFINGANGGTCLPNPDLHGHGTHVAGTIAGVANNEIGITGVMQLAKVMALRFLDADGFGNTDDAVAAILFAANNEARIINASWGSEGRASDAPALYDAIAYAATKNVLFVAAAGNSAADMEVFPFAPSGFNLPNIITVAATDNADQLAGFSNYGPTTVDLGAPGVSIYSTYPPDGYEYLDGTSMAAPHVSGVAGLILSAYPDISLSYQQVKNTILNGVDWTPSLVGKTVTGGRLNAYKSLTSLILLTPNEGVVGTVFKITGTHFGSKKGKAKIGRTAVKILQWSDEVILCQVTRKLPPGTYNVTIERKQPKRAPAIHLDFEFTFLGLN